MRDIALSAILFPIIFAAIKRPWIGIIGWVWVSLMSPHRYTYGFAYDLPWAYMLAIGTTLGMLFTKQVHTIFVASPTHWIVVFCAWMTVSWLLGYDPAADYDQWFKVMKIFLVILLSVCLLRTKQHIIAMAWVCGLSIGILGAKGGLYTIGKGGGGQVLGPPGSFIGDNNTFGLALVMTVPMLRFLHMQVVSKWGRWVLMAMMLLTALAGLGTQSRGALVAMVAMTLMLWMRGGKHVTSGFVIGVAAILLIGFMPEEWMQKMHSIKDYDNDVSSLGRINSWMMALGVANHSIAGAGFNVQRIEYYLLYAPYMGVPLVVAHSIYFQVLGNHGWIGLAIFITILASTWRLASRVRKNTAGKPELLWCWQLAGMCQVALAGYAVGGAFLSLAYFDLPYYLMVIIVLTHLWVERRAWETEPLPKPSRWSLPGMGSPVAMARSGSAR